MTAVLESATSLKQRNSRMYDMYSPYDTACATVKNAQPALMVLNGFPLRSAESQPPNKYTRKLSNKT